MKLSKKIANHPDDLGKLEFKKMKILIKKELQRLTKYTSLEKPTQCILLAAHDYPDKKNMILPIFGTWKGKFKNYAKKEAIHEPLGAIGSAYYGGVDKKTEQLVICINLAKGKGKKKLKEIERKFRKLVTQPIYKFVLKEITEKELEELEKQLEAEEEQKGLLENQGTEEVLTKQPNAGIQELANGIQQQIDNVTANLASLFSNDQEPALQPLATIIKQSKQFWATLQNVAPAEQTSLTSKTYAAYAKLEKAMYDYWKKEENLKESYVDFIKNKIAKVFSQIFQGKTNSAHGGYGSGKKLYGLANSYQTYQEINEVSTALQELGEKYKGQDSVQASIEGLNEVVEDTKSLLKGGYQLRDLIKAHYKNTALCQQLLEALRDWEDARAIMMEQILPYLSNYYNIFEATLTQAETAKTIEKEAIVLVKSLAHIAQLLPKFAEMDQFRKKIEKLDTQKVLSQEVQQMAQAEARLVSFLQKMKGNTANWINKYLKQLVQQDEALLQSNKTLQAKKVKLNQRIAVLEKQKTTEEDWESFWSANQQISADFEKEMLALNQYLEENEKLAEALSQSFQATYQGFTAILEQLK